MPIDASPSGTLDIENATLRSREIVALTSMVTGNDVIRSSNPPALEVYGDPSNGGNEARLELVSNTATVSSSAFTRLTSNAGVLSIKTGTDASDNGTITFGGFTNERMRIGSNGKVGIGTNSPSLVLHVHGSITNHNAAPDTGLDSGLIILRNTKTGSSPYSMALGVDQTHGFGYFNAAGNSSVQPICINTRGGNVGIGMSNPGVQLHIKGTSSRTLTTANGPSYSDYGQLVITDSTAPSGTSTLGNLKIGYDASTGNFGTGFIQCVNTNVYTGPFVINPYGGNVGIGTTDPKTKLHVGVGNAILRIGAVNYAGSAADTTTYGLERSRNQILFSTWRDAQTDKIGAKICGINKQTYSTASSRHLIQSTDLAIYTLRPNTSNYDDTTERLRITDTGNVGIGDATPGSKLDVNGSVTCTSLTETSDDRIKYNEQDVSNALTLISQLNPQKYEKIMERPNPTEGTWIPTDEDWENVKEDYTYGDEFGFIAQDVRAVPELAFLVHGEETRTDTKTSTPEEYSNLTTEEQATYTPSYVYDSNVITQAEYSNLNPEEQGLYSTQYTKQIETQTPLALNYQGLFVVAIGAIKELKAKNDALEARIMALEGA